MDVGVKDMGVKVRYVVVCPKCGKADDGRSWRETWKECNEYKTVLREDGTVEYTGTPEHIEGELDMTYHTECDFETHAYRVEDFVVGLQGDTVVEVGEYRQIFPEDLRRVAEKHGWMIAEDVNEKD